MSQTILSPGLQVWGPGPVAAVNGTGSNSTGNTGPLSGNGLQSILIGEITPLPLPVHPPFVAFLSVDLPHLCCKSLLMMTGREQSDPHAYIAHPGS